MTSRIIPTVALAICATLSCGDLVLQPAVAQTNPYGAQTGAYSAGPAAQAGAGSTGPGVSTGTSSAPLYGRYNGASDSISAAATPAGRAPSAPAVIREYEIDAPPPPFEFADAPASPSDVSPVYRDAPGSRTAAVTTSPSPGTNVVRGEMFLAAQAAGVGASPSHGPGQEAPVPSQPTLTEGFGPSPRLAPSGGIASADLAAGTSDAHHSKRYDGGGAAQTVPQYDPLAPVEAPAHFVAQQELQQRQALQQVAAQQAPPSQQVQLAQQPLQSNHIDHNVAPATYLPAPSDSPSSVTPTMPPPEPIDTAEYAAAQEPQPIATAAAPVPEYTPPPAIPQHGDRYESPPAFPQHDHSSDNASPERFLGSPQAAYSRSDALGLNQTDQAARWSDRLGLDSVTATIGAVALVVGLILIGAWVVRRSFPKAMGRLPEEVVSVVGRTPLSGRQTAQLIRVGRKLVLVSVTQDGAEALTEVTDPVEVDRLLGLCQEGQEHSSTANFEEVFRQLSQTQTRGGFRNSDDQPIPPIQSRSQANILGNRRQGDAA